MNTRALIVGVLTTFIAMFASGADPDGAHHSSVSIAPTQLVGAVTLKDGSGLTGHSTTNEWRYSVQEIPRDGFESLAALKRFATAWPGQDLGIESRHLIECTIGKNQAWALVRSVGASAGLMEVAIFAQSMGRYLVNIWIPPALASLDVEQSAAGTLDIYTYNKLTHGKQVVLTVRELVAAGQP